jgi:hypothetical protein
MKVDKIKSILQIVSIVVDGINFVLSQIEKLKPTTNDKPKNE